MLEIIVSVREKGRKRIPDVLLSSLRQVENSLTRNDECDFDLELGITPHVL